jgi:hypothetical protein
MLLRVFPRISELFTMPNERLEAFKFARPEALEAMSKPSIVRPVRVPTDVMLGWVACETTSATVALATFPVTLDPEMFASPEALDAMSKPSIVRPVKVPTEVMLGWDACETTMATSAFATLPTRFEESREEIEDPFPAMFVNVAVPRTYKLEPLGGLLRDPIDTPFW